MPERELRIRCGEMKGENGLLLALIDDWARYYRSLWLLANPR